MFNKNRRSLGNETVILGNLQEYIQSKEPNPPWFIRSSLPNAVRDLKTDVIYSPSFMALIPSSISSSKLIQQHVSCPTYKWPFAVVNLDSCMEDVEHIPPKYHDYHTTMVKVNCTLVPSASVSLIRKPDSERKISYPDHWEVGGGESGRACRLSKEELNCNLKTTGKVIQKALVAAGVHMRKEMPSNAEVNLTFHLGPPGIHPVPPFDESFDAEFVLCPIFRTTYSHFDRVLSVA